MTAGHRCALLGMPGRDDAYLAQRFEQRHFGALFLREQTPFDVEDGALEGQLLRHLRFIRGSGAVRRTSL